MANPNRTSEPRPEVEVIDPELVVWDDWDDQPADPDGEDMDLPAETGEAIDAVEIREISSPRPLSMSSTAIPLSPTAVFAATHLERARASLERFYGPSRASGSVSATSASRSSKRSLSRWRRSQEG